MGEAVINDKTVLAFLKAKRAALDKVIALMEGKVVGELMLPSEMGGTSQEVHGDTFTGMNISTGSVKYLEMVGRPARTTEEIHAALAKGGLSRVSRASVATILQRVDNSAGEIVKVGRALWGLESWYPNRPRQNRKRAGTEEGQPTASTEKKPPQTRKTRTAAKKPTTKGKPDHIAVRWVQAIREAGKEGLTTPKLAAALGYDSGRSIPFLAASVNKKLAELDFDHKAVYEGKRIGKEHRWFAKERLEEALKALQA